MSKYLAVMMTQDEVREHGLEEVIPTRVKKTRRELTLNCLFSSKPEHEEWVMCREPNEEERRKMLACVVSIGVEVVMRNHTYTMGEKIYQQREGCPIGLDLSQAVARSVMMKYDREFIGGMERATGLKMRMYARYVDDTNLIVESEEEDEERVAQSLMQIANGVIEGIEMKSDLPSRHTDRKLPILDMKCWLQEGVAYYMHYEKEVASKLVIPIRSAHSNSCKRSVHINELVRRCLNTLKDLGWSEYFAPALEDYMVRMKKGGYNEIYRRDVLANAIHIYEKKLSDSEAGGTPLNRASNYQRVERRKEKRIKKKNWSRKGEGVLISLPPHATFKIPINFVSSPTKIDIRTFQGRLASSTTILRMYVFIR